MPGRAQSRRAEQRGDGGQDHARLRPAQDCARVGQAACAGKMGGGGVEAANLCFGGDHLWLVGAGEVCHQRDVCHLAACAQPLPGAVDRSRQEASAVHAAVDLQPHVDRRRERGALDHLDLRLVVDCSPQAVAGDIRQLLGCEHPFKQQDRLLDAGCAQLERLIEEGHRKPVRLVGQSLRTAHRAVAISIGLDHRQRAPTVKLAGEVVVVAQGGEVDQGAGRTHGGFGRRAARSRNGAAKPAPLQCGRAAGAGVLRRCRAGAGGRSAPRRRCLSWRSAPGQGRRGGSRAGAR